MRDFCERGYAISQSKAFVFSFLHCSTYLTEDIIVIAALRDKKVHFQQKYVVRSVTRCINLFPLRVRRLCRWLTAQRWFDHTILFFIALNCITLAMERPNIPPDSYERVFLVACNYLFTVVFGLEMLVKVRSCGKRKERSQFSFMNVPGSLPL